MPESENTAAGDTASGANINAVGLIPSIARRYDAATLDHLRAAHLVRHLGVSDCAAAMLAALAFAPPRWGKLTIASDGDEPGSAAAHALAARATALGWRVSVSGTRDSWKSRMPGDRRGRSEGAPALISLARLLARSAAQDQASALLLDESSRSNGQG